MFVIVTKFIGPTNHRGSRVKATSNGNSTIVSWDEGRDAEPNHVAAAQHLAGIVHAQNGKYGAPDYSQTEPVSSDLPGGDGARVHVFGVART